MAEQDLRKRIQAQLKPPLPKRFYKEVSIKQQNDGFAVRLDGRDIKTKIRKSLMLPNAELAGLIAKEWRAQEEFINPSTMPMTRLANTAIDLMAVDRQFAQDEILGFAASDLLCYRVQSPAGLVSRQNGLWNPVLDLVEQKLGATFKTTAGILHVEQSQEALGAIKNWLAGVGAFPLAAIHTLTTLTGSALLAWALSAGEISTRKVWEHAHLDEGWQQQQWGEDAEARTRKDNREKEYAAAVQFLKNC